MQSNSTTVEEEKLADERRKLEADKTIIGEEKEKLLRELSVKEESLKKEKTEREKMRQKIQAMESKLLKGSNTNFVEKTNKQQRALEQQRIALNEILKAERQAAQELELKVSKNDYAIANYFF